MKAWTKLTAVLVVVAMASVAVAADKPAKERKPGLRAEIVKVEGTSVVVKVGKKGEDEKEMTIKTDAKTVVAMVDGKLGKLEDLKPGTRVLITPETGGTAVKIQERKEKK